MGISVQIFVNTQLDFEEAEITSIGETEQQQRREIRREDLISRIDDDDC